MKIITRTIEQQVYVREDGIEMFLADLDPTHLLNAYRKAVKIIAEAEFAGESVTREDGEYERRLSAEIVRRMRTQMKQVDL